MRKIDVTLLAILVSACAHSHPVINVPYAKAPLPQNTPGSIRACFDDPASQSYLAALHQRIIDAWNVPQGATYEAAIWFTVDTAGIPSNLRVDSAQLDHSQAIRKTVEDSAPFPPLSGAAACLAGQYLKAALSRGPSRRSERLAA
jgi:hypothetical protein